MSDTGKKGTYHKKRTLAVEWKPQDCWVGVFWKRSIQPASTKRRRLDVWVCILPMLPIHYTMREQNTLSSAPISTEGDHA